jgi:AcrR family transcriptional regulator
MTGTPGRPLSPELSLQLLSVAVDILAEDGWSRLNSDRIAARARAGKAGIYRRWASMPALVREAVSRFDLVPEPEDTGPLVGDVQALVRRWTQPLDREERAAASIVGAARHDDDLQAGLDVALSRPLATAVAEIGRRAEERGEPVPAPRLALLGSTLEAFWWQRFMSPGDGAISAERVDGIVADVLAPIVSATEQEPAIA